MRRYTVKSLAELANSMNKESPTTKIELISSIDLICHNLFCEKVALPCLCRLERVMDMYKMPEYIQEINFSGNRLDRIPLSLKRYINVKKVILRDNAINRLEEEQMKCIGSFKSLEQFDLSNNPIPKEDIVRLHAKYPDIINRFVF